MQARYRARVRIRTIPDKPDCQRVPVALPPGTVPVRSPQPSEKGVTLIGIVGVFWERRHDSVSLRDLLNHAGFVELCLVGPGTPRVRSKRSRFGASFGRIIGNKTVGSLCAG